MDKTELAKRVYSVSHLTGSFTLRSGQVSNEYFDKYLFEADPTLLSEVAQHLVKLIPAGTEVLAGLEMGGIPVAVALSLKTGIPAGFVRKKAKEYGTKKFAEGAEVRDRRVCVVEDVVTTGGQIILSATDLRRAGAHVADVLCVIERDVSSKEKLQQEGLRLSALFSMEDLRPASSR